MKLRVAQVNSNLLDNSSADRCNMEVGSAIAMLTEKIASLDEIIDGNQQQNEQLIGSPLSHLPAVETTWLKEMMNVNVLTNLENMFVAAQAKGTSTLGFQLVVYLDETAPDNMFTRTSFIKLYCVRFT